MKKTLSMIGLLAALPLPAAALAQEAAGLPAPQKTDPSFSDFLIDKNAGQISAATLVGVANSAITNVQSAQDIVVAFKPSDGKSKSGFGLSITPAKTDFSPISLALYTNGNVAERFLGSTTLSYATKDVELAGITATKRAVALDASVVLDRNQDPIIVSENAVAGCAEAEATWIQMLKAAKPEKRAEFEKLAELRSSQLKSCIDKEKKTIPWNASRISVAIGAGRVSGDGLSTLGMGNSITINALFPLGPKGAIQPMYRHTWHELDLKTIATTRQTSRTNLAAARVTFGLQEDNRLQILAEVSNLKKVNLAQEEGLFKNAIGIDYGIAKGTWIQLRYGTSRSADGMSFQKKGLFALNFSPTCALSDKCGK